MADDNLTRAAIIIRDGQLDLKAPATIAAELKLAGLLAPDGLTEERRYQDIPGGQAKRFGTRYSNRRVRRWRTPWQPIEEGDTE